jgi:hypothetical protein
MDAQTAILIRDGERGTSRTALTASESDSPKEIAAGFKQKARTGSPATVSKPVARHKELPPPMNAKPPIRVRPVVKPGGYLILKPEYAETNLGRVLRVESMYTPTTYWCLDLADPDPLAVPQLIGTGLLWEHYQAVSEIEAAILLGRVTVTPSEQSAPLFLHGDFMQHLPQAHQLHPEKP